MTDLTPERLQELRRIAEAATPGPWEVVSLSGYGGPYALRMPHRSGRTWYGVEGIKRREDAEYFAACDPDTIRALLAERDALAAENERLNRILGRIVEGDGDSTTGCAGKRCRQNSGGHIALPQPKFRRDMA